MLDNWNDSVSDTLSDDLARLIMISFILTMVFFALLIISLLKRKWSCSSWQRSRSSWQCSCSVDNDLVQLIMILIIWQWSCSADNVHAQETMISLILTIISLILTIVLLSWHWPCSADDDLTHLSMSLLNMQWCYSVDNYLTHPGDDLAHSGKDLPQLTIISMSRQWSRSADKTMIYSRPVHLNPRIYELLINIIGRSGSTCRTYCLWPGDNDQLSDFNCLANIFWLRGEKLLMSYYYCMFHMTWYLYMIRSAYIWDTWLQVPLQSTADRGEVPAGKVHRWHRQSKYILENKTTVHILGQNSLSFTDLFPV
jgi:hypothetical protein